MSLEVSLRNKVCKPGKAIEMCFDLKNVLRNLHQIEITLVLELQVWTLNEPLLLIEQIN